MEYMGNQDFWDQKFTSRGKQPLAPEAVLVELCHLLKKGSVVDLACGDGRNTLFLLDQGFEVTALDFSQAGLERLESFASQSSTRLSTMQVDLTSPKALVGLETYDNAVICHYRLSRDLLGELHHYIADQGCVLVTGFGHRHETNERIGENELIYPEDMAILRTHFDIIHEEEAHDQRGTFNTYLLKKK